MLNAAIFSLVIAFVTAVLGFGGIASASAGIAQTLFIVFLILLVGALTLRNVQGS